MTENEVSANKELALLTSWLNNPFRRKQLTSQKYYEGVHDISENISEKKRQYINENGNSVPNKQITDNLYRKIVDQKVQFVSGRKLKFVFSTTTDIDYSNPESVSEKVKRSVDEDEKLRDEFLRLLEKLFDKKWYVRFREALTYCILDGECWIYPYIDENGDFAYRFFRGRDICPIYTDETKEKISAILRVYELHSDTAQQKHRFIEVYRKENMTRYEYDLAGNTKDETIADYILVDNGVTNSTPQSYQWETFPFIRISSSSISPAPLLNRCKSIIDVINKIDAHYLEFPPKPADVEAHLAELRRRLFEVCCAFDDTRYELFGSNLSMEQDAYDLIMSIEEAVTSLVYNFFVPYLTLKGFKDYSKVGIEFEVEDDKPRNIAELTNLLVSMGMRISNRTMLEHHPWIKDVDEELDRI